MVSEIVKFYKCYEWDGTRIVRMTWFMFYNLRPLLLLGKAINCALKYCDGTDDEEEKQGTETQRRHHSIKEESMEDHSVMHMENLYFYNEIVSPELRNRETSSIGGTNFLNNSKFLHFRKERELCS